MAFMAQRAHMGWVHYRPEAQIRGACHGLENISGLWGGRLLVHSTKLGGDFMAESATLGLHFMFIVQVSWRIHIR